MNCTIHRLVPLLTSHCRHRCRAVRYLNCPGTDPGAQSSCARCFNITRFRFRLKAHKHLTSAANPRCTGNNFTGCFRATQDGYPSGLTNNATLFIPRDKRTAYIRNWQLSVQRELTSNMLIDLAYLGNHAVKLILLADLNQARPNNPGENTPLNDRRPIRGFGSISAVLPAAFSNYHALQIKFERRFSKGVYVLNSFTWSKAMDNAGPVLAPSGERAIDNYFNRNNIVIPSVNQPFGNAGRNIARSQPFYQFDLGLQKNFRLPINEVSKIEFRMEAFNLFNKTNFGAANPDRSSGAFGTIRSTFPARQIQFALKLAF